MSFLPDFALLALLHFWRKIIKGGNYVRMSIFLALKELTIIGHASLLNIIFGILKIFASLLTTFWTPNTPANLVDERKKILSSKRRRTSQRPGFKFLRVLTSTLLGEIVLPLIPFLQDECQISLVVDFIKFAKYHGCMCLCICACVSVCMFVCLGVCATCLCMPTASIKSSSNFHDRQCNYSCGFCFHTAKTSLLLPIEVFMFFFSRR